jgi:hypothetical protein
MATSVLYLLPEAQAVRAKNTDEHRSKPHGDAAPCTMGGVGASAPLPAHQGLMLHQHSRAHSLDQTSIEGKLRMVPGLAE